MRVCMHVYTYTQTHTHTHVEIPNHLQGLQVWSDVAPGTLSELCPLPHLILQRPHPLPGCAKLPPASGPLPVPFPLPERLSQALRRKGLIRGCGGGEAHISQQPQPHSFVKRLLQWPRATQSGPVTSQPSGPLPRPSPLLGCLLPLCPQTNSFSDISSHPPPSKINPFGSCVNSPFQGSVPAHPEAPPQLLWIPLHYYLLLDLMAP